MRKQAVALCVLQGLDVVTTWRGLEVAAERNPIGQAVLSAGLPGLVLAKLAGTAAILVLAWVLWRDRRTQDHALVALAGCCFVMLGVVAWNLWIIALRS